MRGIVKSCLLTGLPVSAGGMLAAAALLTAVDCSPGMITLFAVLPLLCGCFLSGITAARQNRRNGLLTGCAAALLLTLLWYVAVFAVTRRLTLPRVLLLTIPCGMCGGVCGVNTPLPLPKRKLHLPERTAVQLSLRKKLLHQPKRSD